MQTTKGAESLWSRRKGGRNMDNLAALPFREKLSAHITLMKNKIFLKANTKNKS